MVLRVTTETKTGWEGRCEDEGIDGVVQVSHLVGLLVNQLVY